MKALIPYIVFLSVCSLLLQGCIVPPGTPLTRFDDLSSTSSFEANSLKSIVDDHGTHWAVFISNWYGYLDFWLTFSSNGKVWSRPFFTAVPVIAGSYDCDISEYKFGIKLKRRLPDKLQFWRTRTSWCAAEDSCIIPIRDLVQDSDADGLTDYAEYILHSDPLDIDTDNDGKADGYDQNPLAAPMDSIPPPAALHKQIIEWELDAWNYVGAVIVEKFNDYEIEYERDRGIILSMPSDSIDAYLQENDYGIPVLNVHVEPAANGMFKADYTLFISPDDAEGFEALYKWQDGEWRRKKTLREWIAKQ